MRLLPCLLMLLTCCSSGSEQETLNVYAAASLRDLLELAADSFKSETGTEIRISTGGSGLITEQILAGAPADVFISAGSQEIDRLVDAGRVAGADVARLFSNQLVVIAPALNQTDQGSEAFALDDLALAERVAIAHPEAVPAGRYARAWLVSEGLWGQVEQRVVRGLDVRSTLAAVASGGAQFGVVYASDAQAFPSVRVVFSVPTDKGPKIVYPGAPLVGTEKRALARRFLDRLGQREGPWADQVVKLGFRLAP